MPQFGCNIKKNNNVGTKRIYFLLLLLYPLALMAQGGESAFNFLRLPYSSRAAALGGSNISIIDDDLSLSMHNPALLINATDKTIDLSFMTYMSGSKMAGAAFNKTFGQRSAGAVAARYIDYGKFDGYTPDNIFTGTFRAMDMELDFIYSYLLSERWSGGVAGKFIYSQYESLNSLALGVDLGLNYYNSDHMLSLSVVARNLGGQVKTFDGMHEPLPFNLLVGISKDFAHAPVRLSFTLTDLHKWQAEDFYNSGDDAWGDILLKHFILGVDIFPTRNTYLSVGYNFLLHSELKNHARRSLEGFSVGAGLQVRSIKMGVSYGKYHVAASSLMMNFALTL